MIIYQMMNRPKEINFYREKHFFIQWSALITRLWKRATLNCWGQLNILLCERNYVTMCKIHTYVFIDLKVIINLLYMF